MEMVSQVLMGVGVVLAIVGALWFLVESFRESIWWGLGCVFISPIQLVFLIMHWGVAKKPFGLQLLGIMLVCGSAFFAEPEFSYSY